MNRDIADLREDYRQRGLTEAEAGDDPVALFQRWLDEAIASGTREPNAMALGTVDAGGRPAVRVVLLKGFDARGLVFYTNFESRKVREIDATGRASLCFNWLDLERQVRVEGTTERVASAEADAYFAARPRGSQLGAWASPQSEEVASREVLEQNLTQLTAEYEGRDIPRPPHWGGIRVVPEAFEFWQGRASRLHDRLRFTRTGEGWSRVRLGP